ncbi:hypothetical protein MMC31_008256 [Peltigera leucophlebia]|nr:hypothetical protein [Peltigera leucophlebia]
MPSFANLIQNSERQNHALAATTAVLAPHIEATLTVGLFARNEEVYESQKLNFTKLTAITWHEYFLISGERNETFSPADIEQLFVLTVEGLRCRPAANDFVRRIREDAGERGSILRGLRDRYNQVSNPIRERLGLPLREH